MYKYIFLLLLFVIQSCSNPNKSSNKSDSDFLAYYNTFYMAEKYYEEALKIINLNQTDITPKEADDLLNKAIENSLVIEKKFYNSQYVDDSYYILAMSSFYKNNITSSEYYFNRIIDEHNESKYYNLSLIMFGNLYLKMNRINELESLIDKINNEINLDKDEKYLFHLLIADYYKHQDDLVKVEENYLLALNNSVEKNDRISIYYKLLKLSEYSKNFINAIKYIDEIQSILGEQKINDELFQKWINYNINIQEYNKIIKVLKDYINNEFIDKMKIYYQVELANVYIHQKSYIDAKEILLKIIDEYKEHSTLKKELEKAYLLLGNLYLEFDWNFDLSKEAYQDCINISKSSLYGKESENKINSITSFLNYQEEIFYIETINADDESLDNEDLLSTSEISKNDGLDSLLFHSGQILYFDLGSKDSSISRFKKIVNKFSDSKYHYKSLLILDLEQPNSRWKEIIDEKYTDLGNNKIENIQIDLLIDQSWDLLSQSYNKGIDSFLHIYEAYNSQKSLYTVGFIYDDYLKDIDNAILYYKMYLDNYKDGEYFQKINDRLLELESMIDIKIKYHEQKINLRKGINWFKNEFNFDSSLYYINLASNGIDRDIKVYCNNISESIRLYEENEILLKNNYPSIDSVKLNLAHILYKDLSFDENARKYYKEIIFNNSKESYLNESYACLSFIEDDTSWDSLLYSNLNDSNLYHVLKNNAHKKFYYKLDGSLELDSSDLLWFNNIQNKYFLKIEENNLEIE